MRASKRSNNKMHFRVQKENQAREVRQETKVNKERKAKPATKEVPVLQEYRSIFLAVSVKSITY